jgi:hypothetical protein
MDKDLDSTKSFIFDCRNNPQALRNYANLLYGGLAKIPGGQRAKVLSLLYQYVDKCPSCKAPVGRPTADCIDCPALLEKLIAQTQSQFNKAKNMGFYCIAIGKYSLEGLPEAYK